MGSLQLVQGGLCAFARSIDFFSRCLYHAISHSRCLQLGLLRLIRQDFAQLICQNREVKSFSFLLLMCREYYYPILHIIVFLSKRRPSKNYAERSNSIYGNCFVDKLPCDISNSSGGGGALSCLLFPSVPLDRLSCTCSFEGFCVPCLSS